MTFPEVFDSAFSGDPRGHRVVVGVRVFDWLLRLPDEWEREFMRELMALEEETKMPYITSVERIGRQEGRQEGLNSERQLLLRQVRRRFGSAVAERSQALLERIGEPVVLEELGEALLDCADGEAWLAALARRMTT